MDHVIGIFCDPNLGFPGDLRYEIAHCGTILECRNEDQARFAASEKVLEFLTSLAIDWSGTGDSFDEKQPILGGVVDDDIRDLAAESSVTPSAVSSSVSK